MDLSIYNVIVGPHLSSKAYLLNQQDKQLVLKVHVKANKNLVEEALKKLFNVNVEKIRIVVSKGKQRRSGKFFSKSSDYKKAIVTLKQGQSLDVMGWNQPVMDMMPSEQ